MEIMVQHKHDHDDFSKPSLHSVNTQSLGVPPSKDKLDIDKPKSKCVCSIAKLTLMRKFSLRFQPYLNRVQAIHTVIVRLTTDILVRLDVVAHQDIL